MNSFCVFNLKLMARRYNLRSAEPNDTEEETIANVAAATAATATAAATEAANTV